MLSRLSAAIVGLLAFAGCILVGLMAGNPFGTIILRSLGGLVGGMVVGFLAGHIAQVVIHEQFRNMVAADIAEESARATAVAAAENDENDPAEPLDTAAGENPADRVGTDANPQSPETADAAAEPEALAARAARELLPEAR